MDELQAHLSVLFAWMQPELLLQALLQDEATAWNVFPIGGGEVSQAAYTHCGAPHLKNRSMDEIAQLYWNLRATLDRSGGVLALPAIFGEKVLHWRGTEPVCRQEHLLKWRETSHLPGQDLFTCALLARQDAQRGRVSSFFTWPAVIRTDDYMLWARLEQGVSENHFHLNGSTQIFPLVWGFLMNYPERIPAFFQSPRFADNLRDAALSGVRDNQLPWKERLYYAAWIRAFLFQRIHTPERGAEAEGDFRAFARGLGKRLRLQEQVKRLRFLYGARFLQPDGKQACLDYAITPETKRENQGAFRFLAGERSFLYRCFQSCYTGCFSKLEQDLFYLYLLVKIRLRGELVQSNDRVGFHNFSDYQDRKADGWAARPEYRAESLRLAINGTLAEGVKSLEMRIMPKDQVGKLRQSIRDADRCAEFAARSEFPAGPAANWDGTEKDGIREREKEPPYFFVLHFGKKQLGRTDRRDALLPLPPRNQKNRAAAARQAKALARALERDPALCRRIRGIDGCSHEIGCRPETFATEYRFLRGFCIDAARYQRSRRRPMLGATYHAGEDFLDIADGLRAIDEAVLFLNFQRGDRLGHALALGIAPEAYYRFKAGMSILPKQDLLDNLTWILFRCMQWGIHIPSELSSRLEEKAEGLLHEIYGSGLHDLRLSDYFSSWLLRGDHPSLYAAFDGTVRPVQEALEAADSGLSRYSPFQINRWTWDETELDIQRGRKKVLRFLCKYHFDRQTRLTGQEPITFPADEPYVRLMRQMQDYIMGLLMERGICIECNPTSNYLIGTFKHYGQHPIFRFNHFGLSLPEFQSACAQLQVSVNTDDQGVFDTSLENEYALLLSALQSRRDDSGRRLLGDDEINTYLDHLRRMGNEMVFPAAK